MTELEYLKNRIREHMNRMADHMSTGGCESHESYKECVGIVNGLAIIEREILDLEDKLKDSE